MLEEKFFLIIFLFSLFTGCSTPGELSSIDQHRIESLISHIDSTVNSKTVTQQDSTWRQEILRQFQSIREKSDTSHHVVVDSAGRVIKETLVINNVREVTNETDRQEREFLMHRLDIQDSTINLMRHQLSYTDSLIQQKQQPVKVPEEKDLNWFQQMQLWLGRLVLIALAVLIAVWVIRKRSWLVSILRKLL